MSHHVIHFMRSINSETLAGFQQVTLSALQQGATKLEIHISSDGGSNDQGFAVYHFLRSLPVPIVMHCIGNVESMAVIMFLAGSERVITPHGKIKIHPMHWGFPGGTVDHDRLAEYIVSLDFDAERYANIFNERTQGSNEPVNVRAHLMGQAKLLGAAAAVSSGIATAIAEATIPAAAILWWV